MHPDWATDILDRCVEAGIPYLFKQWGEWAPATGEPREGDRKVLLDPWNKARAMRSDEENWEAELWDPNRDGKADASIPRFASRIMRRVGKKEAGRLLDGRTWDEYPGG